MKPVRTMILLASERRMRLIENAGVGKGLTEIADYSVDDLGEVRADYADDAGRQQAAPGSGGHGFERTTSVRRQKREDFASHVMDEAAGMFTQNGYDRLVISAAPKMLGALRDEMPDALKGALRADLDKDLAKLPLKDLETHLADVLAV